jgi:hypothetical protein
MLKWCPSINEDFYSRSRHARKYNRRHIVDIPRIYPPQEDYFLSITQRLGKKAIYGWAQIRI